MQLIKYMSKQTLNIEEKVGAESMRMSDLTLCPYKPYKTPGFHFNQSAFEEQTYKFDDIFHNQTELSLGKKVSKAW